MVERNEGSSGGTKIGKEEKEASLSLFGLVVRLCGSHLIGPCGTRPANFVYHSALNLLRRFPLQLRCLLLLLLMLLGGSAASRGGGGAVEGRGHRGDRTGPLLGEVHHCGAEVGLKDLQGVLALVHQGVHIDALRPHASRPSGYRDGWRLVRSARLREESVLSFLPVRLGVLRGLCVTIWSNQDKIISVRIMLISVRNKMKSVSKARCAATSRVDTL